MTSSGWTWLFVLGAGFLLGAFTVAVIKSAPVTYTNEETWEITRDYRGRMTGVVVHRNARET